MGVGRQSGWLLRLFGAHVSQAFGHTPYQVGSSLTQKRDWRDVDVRLILPDDEYEAMFGDARCPDAVRLAHEMAWSAFGRELTGLPIRLPVPGADRREHGPRERGTAIGATDPRRRAGRCTNLPESVRRCSTMTHVWPNDPARMRSAHAGNGAQTLAVSGHDSPGGRLLLPDFTTADIAELLTIANAVPCASSHADGCRCPVHFTPDVVVVPFERACTGSLTCRCKRCDTERQRLMRAGSRDKRQPWQVAA